MPQITHIAATESNTGDRFDKYVIPIIQINSGATDVTWISIVDDIMKMKGEVVHPVRVL